MQNTAILDLKFEDLKNKITEDIQKQLLEFTLLINSTQKEVLNVTEAARYTSLATSQIYKLTHLHEIPHYKPRGKKIYFKRSELDEWLLTNKQLSHAEIEEKALQHVLRGE